MKKEEIEKLTKLQGRIDDMVKKINQCNAALNHLAHNWDVAIKVNHYSSNFVIDDTVWPYKQLIERYKNELEIEYNRLIAERDAYQVFVPGSIVKIGGDQ